MKKILIPILLFLLIFSIVVMGAPSYVNVGPTTEFTGDVGVPAGSGYYIGDNELDLGSLIGGWHFTHLEDQLFFGNLAGSGANSDITSLDGLTTPLGPAYGGSGVANNAANTLTFTGNYSLGLTLSANTAVTLPTAGTVATLAGTETLTNKTLTAPIINHNVTTKTTTATLNIAESGLVKVTAAGAYTILLPTAIGNGGLIYIIKKTDDNSNLITIDGNAAETIEGAATYTDLNYKNSYVIIISDNSNWLIIGESTVRGGTF